MRLIHLAVLACLVAGGMPHAAAQTSGATQQAYLKAFSNRPRVGLGYSTAMSGETVLIGAPGESGDASGVNVEPANYSADGSGAAYVFVRNGTNWVPQAYLKPSNNEAGNVFGISVAISGDVAIVGASGESSNASGVNGDPSTNDLQNAGSAYIFVRNGTNWTQQAYLKASNPGSTDNFGSSVAISEDIAVVGARAEDSGAIGVNGNQNDETRYDSGAAYIFGRDGTKWIQQAYLKASNTGDSDHFGASAAIEGDTVVIGAYNESSNATGVNGDQTNNAALESGAAYVFQRSGTNWLQQAYLKASNTGRRDAFASALALSGQTLVVGARSEDSNSRGVNGNQSNDTAGASGAAYVFVREGTNWAQQAYLKATNAQANAFFGFSVSINGNVIAVGAPLQSADDQMVDFGAAHVFRRTGGNWTQVAHLTSSNPDKGDQFGNAVAVAGSTVISASLYEDSIASGVNGVQSDNTGTNSGAGYIFTIPGVASAVRLLYVRSSESLSLGWTSTAILEESAHVLGPWKTVTNAVSPYVVSTTNQPQRFFRLQQSEP